MGLIGVLTAPLVHGSVEHLISNSFPLLVLGTLGLVGIGLMLFLLFTMASVGLPGTSNFVGEFLILIGSFPAAPWVVVLAACGQDG